LKLFILYELLERPRVKTTPSAYTHELVMKNWFVGCVWDNCVWC